MITKNSDKQNLSHCWSPVKQVSKLKVNSYRHARHDTDWIVLSCLVWRCELSRPDSQTWAFCVWSVSEYVRRRSATAGRTPTQNALVRRSSRFSSHRLIRHTQDRLVLSGGRCELGIRRVAKAALLIPRFFLFLVGGIRPPTVPLNLTVYDSKTGPLILRLVWIVLTCKIVA